MVLLHVPTLVFLLAQLMSLAEAGFAPHHSLSRATERLHKFAIRHSAGLARDLRVVFYGRDVADQIPLGSHKVYCKLPDPFNNGNVNGGNSTSPATATSSSAGHSTPTSASGTHGSTTAAAQPTTSVPVSQFKLQDSWSGSDFYSGWSFWDTADPTHGNVQFVDQQTAQSNQLVGVNSAGNFLMRVETTPQVSGNRKSIRITTDNTYTGGIFILDAVHMPTGCGTWPAFWSNGPNWPAGGEIDIVEGVNDYTNNQATIHTNPGCTIPSNTGQGNLAVTADIVGGLNCAAAETGNAGCGMRSTSSSTYGAGFNSNGGGVYAMAWDDSGIRVFFFPRNSIPDDITAGQPNPSSWGTPMAIWPSSQCNPSEFFYNHSIIFDTTLCGDWAGGVWASTGAPGQDQSCAARTGVATCQEYVQNNGAAFQQAYWEVVSVKVYQKSRQS
ncbi:glycoside hydrolase family 16 protein [Rickenella mellea]|uniref:Glycoside hydrolase family 16 protein n=1 Tax=Rickenella mellea TaxID=50990 RepID=A0A4Y7QNB3_9AGAM|nr:glycoside hydrolase family 16 protein [Rickenella mellea]